MPDRMERPLRRVGVREKRQVVGASRKTGKERRRTLMRTPFVKGQTHPLSGFLLFIPPYEFWRHQHLVSCSDLISVHGRQRCVAAPNTY
jgi:hypothetical protein